MKTKIVYALIIIVSILLVWYLWRSRSENLVNYNNTLFEPLPDGIEEDNIYYDGVFYYLVERNPNDRNNYWKRILSSKEAGLLGSPKFKGKNINIALVPDGLPMNLNEGDVIQRSDGRLGKIMSGEFKQYTHSDSYNKAGQPWVKLWNYDADKLQYVMPNNVFTYGLMAGPFWMIDSNKF